MYFPEKTVQQARPQNPPNQSHTNSVHSVLCSGLDRTSRTNTSPALLIRSSKGLAEQQQWARISELYWYVVYPYFEI